MLKKGKKRNKSLDEDVVQSEIDMYRKKGPRGVLIGRFCAFTFENMTCTDLCEEIDSEKVDYIGYVLGYSLSEFCALDVKDDEEKHREYAILHRG